MIFEGWKDNLNYVYGVAGYKLAKIKKKKEAILNNKGTHPLTGKFRTSVFEVCI